MKKVFQVCVETCFEDDKRFDVNLYSNNTSATEYGKKVFNEFIVIGKLTDITETETELTAFDERHDNYVHVKVSEVEVLD